MKLLVVEDNKKVASFLERGLREETYVVDVAFDATDGAMKARVYDYDLLLVDVMLPGKTGFELVRELRAGGSSVPILMLTALDSEADIIMGLDAGADDYLTKPFGFDELLARVRALLRRGGSGRGELLICGDVEVDRVKHVAHRAGKRLKLSPKEFQLLDFFVLHPEQVIRRTELLEKVWDLTFDPMSNVVDVHIGNLRRKLAEAGEGPLVHTVRGVGYIFQNEEPE